MLACRQVAEIVDTPKFQKLQQFAKNCGDSKGVSTTLQMRALQTSYNSTAVRIFVRVFRLVPGQQPLEHPSAPGFSPDAPDLEDKIRGAIEVAADALYDVK